MTKFNIGDKIRLNSESVIYTVLDIDELSCPIPKYLIGTDDGFSIWDYCIGWEHVDTVEGLLRYGNVLTDDMFKKRIIDDSGWDLIRTDYVRIRTISYDNRIFYHKMVNGEVVEFKELTV